MDSLVPIHIVTNASQIPAEFLEPSSASQLIVGFDCEAVDLCRHGTVCIMQFTFPDAIYLVCAIQGGKALMEAFKPALESSYITKVIHGCKRDSEIAYTLMEEQEGRKRSLDDCISFVGFLADPGISYQGNEEVCILLRQDPKFWTYRPLTELLLRAAVDDVRFLAYIYHNMMKKLCQ